MERFDAFCTALNKYRITSSFLGLGSTPVNKEQCLTLLNFLKPVRIHINSAYNNHYEALLESKLPVGSPSFAFIFENFRTGRYCDWQRMQKGSLQLLARLFHSGKTCILTSWPVNFWEIYRNATICLYGFFRWHNSKLLLPISLVLKLWSFA